MRTKAALLIAPGRIQIAEIPAPEPRPNEVLVRLRLAGACGADYAIYSGMVRGPLPPVPGYEAVGEVASLAARASRFRVGEQATCSPVSSAGNAIRVEAARPTSAGTGCGWGLDVHGVFPDYAAAPFAGGSGADLTARRPTGQGRCGLPRFGFDPCRTQRCKSSHRRSLRSGEIAELGEQHYLRRSDGARIPPHLLDDHDDHMGGLVA